jgi:hypothetical protein
VDLHVFAESAAPLHAAGSPASASPGGHGDSGAEQVGPRGRAASGDTRAPAATPLSAGIALESPSQRLTAARQALQAKRGADARRPEAVPGVPVHPVAALDAVEGLVGPYDAVVLSLAADEHHVGSLAALRRRRDSIVLAHDVYLADLYADAARAGALPGGLGDVIRTAYGETVMPGIGDDNTLDASEARRLGILLTRDVLQHCRRFLALSGEDAALARLDARAADRSKVQALRAATPASAVAAVVGSVSGGTFVDEPASQTGSSTNVAAAADAVTGDSDDAIGGAHRWPALGRAGGSSLHRPDPSGEAHAFDCRGARGDRL